MGDEISMKKILILAVFVAGVYAAPDMSAYEDKFNALSQKRVGLDDKDILSLKNPFPIEELKSTISEEIKDTDLVGKELDAIIADRVRINKDWYKIGDNIGAFEIKEIKDKSVIIENEKKSLELKLKQGNKNVKIN